MSSLNEFSGGNELSTKPLDSAYDHAVRTAADMQQLIDTFTEGQSKAVSARFSAMIGNYEQFEQLKTKIAENSQIERLQNELKKCEEGSQEQLRLQEELSNEIIAVGNRTMSSMQSLYNHMYSNSTSRRKAQMKEAEADALAQSRKTITEKYQLEWAAAEGNQDKQDALTAKYRRDVKESIIQEKEARDTAKKLQQSDEAKNYANTKRHLDDLANHPSLKNASKVVIDAALVGSEGFKDISKQQQAIIDESEGNLKQLDAYKEELMNAGMSEEEAEAVVAEDRKENQERIDAAKKLQKAADSIGDAAAKIEESFEGAFKEVETMMNSYMGKIDSRLQGSETSYNKAMDKISSNLSLSPFVKSQKAIESMRALVDQGVAYNLEQRAFLGTVSEKIASTFDAFDSNLARLIRLQQADTTAARLGMEAALTKFLNGMYQDTSYLTTVADSVTSVLIDASSTMTRNQSAEFEYTVQKWLGSLSSLGMSEQTINQIATGLNYLATGDVNSLSSNTQLQTLLAMSSAKAGLEYSDLLLKGLDSSKTNKLMEAMVVYLKDIAENSDNQVVRAAYGEIFNLSMSDMKAISNLRQQDILSISNSNLSYSGMEQELTNQFVQLISRTSLTEMMNNLYENAVFGVAEDLVSNPATYAMYKMLGFLEERKLDINIPFISAAGFGLDLNTSVQGLLNLGIGLSSAFSLVGNILSGLGSMGGLNLDAWGGSEYTSRGSATSFSTSASDGETSGSTYVGSGSAEDMETSALSSATDDAEDTKKVTNKNSDPGKTINDLYEVTVEGSTGTGFVRVKDQTLPLVFNSTSDFLHARDSRLTFYNDQLLNVYDSVVHQQLSDVLGTSSLVDSKPNLRVIDNTAIEVLRTVFGNKSVVYNGVIGVRDDSLAKTLSVKDVGIQTALDQTGTSASLRVSDNKTAEAIKSLSDKTSSTVSLTATTIKSITDAITGTNTQGKPAAKTLTDVYNLFAGSDAANKAHVRIQNEDGRRLQVDTEFVNMTDGYDYSSYTNIAADYATKSLSEIKW